VTAQAPTVKAALRGRNWPARRDHRHPRRCRAGHRSGPDHAERADQVAESAGADPFSPAPRRGDLPVQARHCARRSPSSGTHPAATPPPGPARTTPGPAPSPAGPALANRPGAAIRSPAPGRSRPSPPSPHHPEPRACYDKQLARGLGHKRRTPPAQQPPRRHPAQLPETTTCYDEATAWPGASHTEPLAA
jgi:hypothetical protein